MGHGLAAQSAADELHVVALNVGHHHDVHLEEEVEIGSGSEWIHDNDIEKFKNGRGREIHRKSKGVE